MHSFGGGAAVSGGHLSIKGGFQILINPLPADPHILGQGCGQLLYQGDPPPMLLPPFPDQSGCMLGLRV